MDRKAALDYAEKNWDRPCQDDGEIMLREVDPFWNTDTIEVSAARTKLHAPASDGWEARFVPIVNGGKVSEEAAFIKPSPAGVALLGLPGTWLKITIQGWDGLSDCAHYLSRCLIAGKAGVPELEDVGKLVKALMDLPATKTKTLVEKVSKSAAERVIDSGIFQPGDFIGYFNTGDFGRPNEYGHSTMYVGDQWITCHSRSRFRDKDIKKQKWDLDKVDPVSFTLIHFTDGDPTPSPDTVKWLEGWWEVKMGAGPSRFYLFQRNGTVQRTNTKPKSNSAPIAHPEDIGYWYEKHFEVVYFWRKTGTEERLVMRDLSDLFALATGNVNYLGRDTFDVIVDGVPGTSAKAL